jgi:hypothetical protein
MIHILWLFVFLVNLSYSQDEKFIQDINQILNSPLPLKHRCLSCPGQQEFILRSSLRCQCQLPGSIGTTGVLKRFKNYQDLPEKIKPLVDFAGIPRNKTLMVYLQIHNDLAMSPIGAIGIMVDPGMGMNSDPEFDVGYTHGMQLMMDMTDNKGKSYSLNAESHLYTKLIEDFNRESTKQFFTEENFFSFMVDNDNTPDALKWKAGLGLRMLNSAEPVFLGAGWQQKAFHQYYQAQGQQRLYEFQADGEKIRLSPLIDLGIGLSQIVAEKGKCQFQLFTGGETRLLPGTNDSRLRGTVTFDSLYKSLKSLTKFKVGADATLHRKGIEFSPKVILSYERKKWGMDMGVKIPLGNLENSVRYNWDKTPTNSMAIYYFFSR